MVDLLTSGPPAENSICCPKASIRPENLATHNTRPKGPRAGVKIFGERTAELELRGVAASALYAAQFGSGSGQPDSLQSFEECRMQFSGTTSLP